jgi:hypothetical protein
VSNSVWGTWIAIALVAAVAAGAAVVVVASGLPANTSLTVGGPALQWSLSKAGVEFTSFAISCLAFTLLVLVFATIAAIWLGLRVVVAGLWRGLVAIAAEVWKGLGFVTALIFSILGLQEVGTNIELGLQAVLALIVAAALFSAVFQNALAILALAIAFLGLGAAICARQAVLELPAGLRVTNRNSAIGGGQSEWTISPALLFSLLAVALVGGTVALGAAALRPVPVTAPAHPDAAGDARDQGKDATGKTSTPEKGETKSKTSPPPANE